MMNRHLYDESFLKELSKHHTKTTYARITALSWDELPLERIEGKITGGTVNIDGSSALRRTCSLTMISNEVNLQNYYWGLQNKFKLEIGLENTINNEYPEIVWFPQGLFIITGFNTNVTVNNCTITIQGKDKMCLLNGDISGSLPSQIDFGIEEYYDVDENITTYNSIPLKTIIKNAVNVYGQELIHNIVINDLDMLGFEQLRYKGDTPLYLIKDSETDTYTNMTLHGEKACYYYYYSQEEKEYKIGNTTLEDLGSYNKNIDIADNEKGQEIYLEEKDGKLSMGPYTVYKAEYGDDIGYRPTELTYAGELIANAGESLTSVLDKIRNMLGNYEYFYDLDGHFVFQRKKDYVDNPWNSMLNSTTNFNDAYAENAAYTSSSVYNFDDLSFFTALTHNPTLNNLKNDFSVWGTRKGTTGQDIPIHLRYALDKKPMYYKNYVGDTYINIEGYEELSNKNYRIVEKDLVSYREKVKSVDWREIVYQMAYDYYNHHEEPNFLSTIINNNNSEYGDKGFINRYPSGYTGYETYYVDMYSFWRDIFDPRKIIPDFPDINKIYYQFSNGLYEEKKNEDLFELPLGEKEISCYEFVGGKYVSGKYKFNFSSISEESLSKYYALVNYSSLGIRSKEQYDNQYKKFNEANALEAEKYQYYIYEKQEDGWGYSPCFAKDEVLKWDPEKIYYKKLTEPVYKPYNFYSWKTDIDPSQIRYLNNSDCDANTGKSYLITQSPDLLDFWIDFIGEDSLMEKYLACNIGSRTKAVNDSDVMAIYFKQVPDILYYTSEEADIIYNSNQPSGYVQVAISPALSNCFSISSQGKSAYDVLEKLLDENTYCIENITITSIPIYHLDVNTRIEINQKESGIEGEYLISKITLPLTYNGTMSITAKKAIDSIY